MLSEPRGLIPDFLERPTFVMSGPPCAEKELDYDESDSHHETGRMAAVLVQTITPTIEQHASEDRLGQVIRETHLAVWSYLDEPVLGRCVIIKERHT